MIRSSFCYCFADGDFADNLKRLADCGFEAVELWSYDLESRPIEQTARDLRRAGLVCSQICPYFDFVHSADEWQESVELGMRYIEYSRALGNPLIRVFTGPLGEGVRVCSAEALPEQWDAAIRGLAGLCAEAEKHKVRFCLEVHPGTLAEDSHSTLRLIRGVGSPNLVANPQIPLLNEDPWYSLGRLAGHVAHCHAHNWSDRVGGTLAPIARGIFDWESYLRTAQADGFDGFVSVEHARDSGGGDPWKAAAIDGPYLRELASRLGDGAHPTTCTPAPDS